MKSNILMVTCRYYPFMGGVETHVHEVGQRLVHQGAKITLLTTMPNDVTLPREEVIQGMRVIRTRVWPKQGDFYFSPEIYSIIRSGKWDIVHCQGCNNFVPLLAMLAAKAANVPYVVTFHTGGHSSRFRNRIRGTQWKILRSLFAGASKLIAVSNFEAEYFRNLLHLPPEQFTVIPNGAVVPDLTQHSFETPPQTLIISVGRLEKYKGHQHLINALPYLLKWRPDVRLLILGTGPYETALHDLARKIGVAKYVEIRSIPANKRREMMETLSQASLVALLSEYEAHPIAIMEALALKRPVLVADTSGFKELAELQLVKSIPLNSSPEKTALVAMKQIEEPIVPPVHFVLPTWDDCAHQLSEVYDTQLRRLE